MHGWRSSRPGRRAAASALAAAVCALLLADAARAASAAKIDEEASAALQQLFAANPHARLLGDEARAILVFPSIVKGGFIFGGQFGDGALRQGGKTAGYYRSVAVSYGLQAGVQAFGYALFFMKDSALDYFKRSDGFEVGMGPSIVVLDKGGASSFSTTTARSDVYAVFFDQKGLMGGLGLQGTKISQIHPD